MPKLKQNERDTITAVVGIEARQHLTELANELTKGGDKTFYASDIVREAIEEYLRAKGRDVSIKVDRGGYRTRRAS